MALGTPTRLYGPGVHNSSNVNTFATGSFTATPGTLLVIPFETQNSAGNMSPGNGLTSITHTFSGTWTGTSAWTIYSPDNALHDPNGGTYNQRLNLAYAVVPSGATTGVITLNFNTGSGGVNRNRNIVIVNVYEITGVDTSAPVTQSISNRAGASSTNTATYGSSLASTSMAVSCVGNAWDTSGPTIVQPTNHTLLHQNNSADGSFNDSLASSYDLTSAGTSLNWTGLSSLYGSSVLGIEVKEGSAAYTSTPSDTATVTDANSKAVTKPLSDTATVTDANAKAVGKPASDSVSTADTIVKAPNKQPADTATVTDANAKAATKPLTDTVNANDTVVKANTKPASDTVTTADANTKSFSKALADSPTVSDSSVRAYSKVIAETITSTDNPQRVVEYLRTIGDTATVTDMASPGGIARSASVDDTVTSSDAITKVISKALSDTASTADVLAKTLNKYPTDSVTSSDAKIASIYIVKTETPTVTDNTLKTASIAKSDAVTPTDQNAKTISKTLVDTVSTADAKTLSFNKQPADSVTATDTQAKAATKLSTDTATVTDFVNRSNSGDGQPEGIQTKRDSDYDEFIHDGVTTYQEM